MVQKVSAGGTNLDVWPTETLTRHDVALVVVGTARVTVARFTAEWVRLREAVVLRETLVTVPDCRHIRLTLALSSLLVAPPAVVHGPERAAGTQLATVWVLRGEVPVAGHAVIAPSSTHELLAVTLTGHSLRLLAGPLVTHPVISRPLRHTVALSADIGVSDLLLWILRRVGSSGEPDEGCY